jgi:hypothetical protein
MAFDEMNLLKEAYIGIQTQFPGLVLDSFDVVSDVVCHRNFWKPPSVRTMLLAESHVYTTESENSFRIDYPKELNQYNIPRNFVRLVYCLAYGEQVLSPQTVRNTGTWQYWKIFAACASDSPDIDFGPVLKRAGETDRERILNKYKVMRKLREKGVWLVDCSSVSLYGLKKKRSEKQKQEILGICWKAYIKRLLDDVKPEYLIVIGKRVGKIVEPGLKITGINYQIFPQPQAWLSSEEQAEILRTYQRICNRKPTV